MKQPELQSLLTEFTADRLALLLRHEAGARIVSHYDFNNTCQYVIAREETHVTWLQAALSEIGAPMPSPAAELSVPQPARVKEGDISAFRPILEDDARQLGALISKWRAKVGEVTHARHRTMLDVIIGESAEHMRLFEQAASGMEDVLGKRTGGVARQGAVLSTRWME
jgi:hypothetical protein